MPDDAAAARALLESSFRGTRHVARLHEQLDAALQFDDPEYLAVLAVRDPEVVALALFGAVSGAAQCTKLHVLAGSDEPALEALAEGIVGVCAEAGERLIVAELPDDMPYVPGAQALLAAGFREEGHVDDYVSDGVGLRLLAWRR